MQKRFLSGNRYKLLWILVTVTGEQRSKIINGIEICRNLFAF